MAQSEHELPILGEWWPDGQQGFLVGAEDQAALDAASTPVETPANAVRKVASTTVTISGDQLGLPVLVDAGSAFGAGRTYEGPRQMPGDEGSAMPEDDGSTNGHRRLILGMLATGLLATGIFAAGKAHPGAAHSLLAKAEKIGLTWRCDSNIDGQQDRLLQDLAVNREAKATVMVGKSFNTGRETVADAIYEDSSGATTEIRKPIRLACRYNPDKKRFIAISPQYLDEAIADNSGKSIAVTKISADKTDLNVSNTAELKAKSVTLHMPDETDDYPYGDNYNAADGLVDSEGRHYAYQPYYG